MLDNYYQLMGWDRKTGKPLPETLKKVRAQAAAGGLVAVTHQGHRARRDRPVADAALRDGRHVASHPRGGIAGALSLGDFLTSLASKYPAVGTVILDVDAGQLFEHVSVVHNDTVLGSAAVLDQRIEAGDSLVLLPAFSGG